MTERHAERVGLVWRFLCWLLGHDTGIYETDDATLLLCLRCRQEVDRIEKVPGKPTTRGWIKR